MDEENRSTRLKVAGFSQEPATEAMEHDQFVVPSQAELSHPLLKMSTRSDDGKPVVSSHLALTSGAMAWRWKNVVMKLFAFRYGICLYPLQLLPTAM
jgi:hypothetical protein